MSPADWRAMVVLAVLNLGAGEGIADGVWHDPWEPWRQDARTIERPYTVVADSARPVGWTARAVRLVFPRDAAELPCIVDVGDVDLSETRGVELTLRFRAGNVPPMRLEASHSLAHLVLAGPVGRRGWWLHAYSRQSAFCLNGILEGGSGQDIRLARGAARPQSGPRWDTKWHTVRLAWCRGQLAASWDGLPILHVVDPGVDYRRLELVWVNPGAAFGTLEMEPVVLAETRFDAIPAVP